MLSYGSASMRLLRFCLHYRAKWVLPREVIASSHRATWLRCTKWLWDRWTVVTKKSQTHQGTHSMLQHPAMIDVEEILACRIESTFYTTPVVDLLFAWVCLNACIPNCVGTPRQYTSRPSWLIDSYVANNCFDWLIQNISKHCFFLLIALSILQQHDTSIQGWFWQTFVT